MDEFHYGDIPTYLLRWSLQFSRLNSHVGFTRIKGLGLVGTYNQLKEENLHVLRSNSGELLFL